MRSKNSSMFTVLVLVLIFITPLFLNAQSDGENESEFNLLRAPISPAFVLLGVSPSVVERPSVLTDLVFTLMNKTENLTTIPKDFALELSISSLFSKKKELVSNVTNNRIGKNIFDTLTLSLATAEIESKEESANKSTHIAIGGKFSPLIGKRNNSEKFEANLKSLKKVIALLRLNTELKRNLTEMKNKLLSRDQKTSDSINIILRNALFPTFEIMNEKDIDSSYYYIEYQEKNIIDEIKKTILKTQVEITAVNTKEVLDEILSNVLDKFLSEIDKHSMQIDLIAYEANEMKAKMHSEIKKETIKTVGFKLECAGGLVVNTNPSELENSSLVKYGAWVTSGCERLNMGSVFVFRWLRNKTDGNTSWDAGIKAWYDFANNYSFDVEFVHRWLSKIEIDEKQWHLACNFNIPTATNKKIVLTFVRDFEGKTSGNWKALVNLIFGFGANRDLGKI